MAKDIISYLYYQRPPLGQEMIWRQGKYHCGVLRLENLPRSERLTLLNEVLDRHAKDLEAGSIVIALRAKPTKTPSSRPSPALLNS